MAFWIPLMVGSGLISAGLGGISSIYFGRQNYLREVERERWNNDYFKNTGKKANYPRLSGHYADKLGAVLGGASGFAGSFAHGVYSASLLSNGDVYRSDDDFDEFYGGYY